MGFPRPIGNHFLSIVVMPQNVLLFFYYLTVLVVNCHLKLYDSIISKFVSINEKRGVFIVQDFVNDMISIAKRLEVTFRTF